MDLFKGLEKALPELDIDLPNVDVQSMLPDFGNFGNLFQSFGKIFPDIDTTPTFYSGTLPSFRNNTIGGTYWPSTPSWNSNLPILGTGQSGWSDMFNFPWLRPKPQDPNAMPGGIPGGDGFGLGAASGGNAVLNRWDAFFQEASQRYGVPANLIKAIAMVEQGFTQDGRMVNNPIGATGIMQIMPGIWSGAGQAQGLPNWATDPRQNILLGAYILAQNKAQHGSWEMAAQAYLGFGTDMYGTNNNTYWARVKQYWDQLNASGGTIPGSGGFSSGGSGVGAYMMQFVGRIPYVWGGIPGAGQTPTGWDCSGMTYWMAQNFGVGRTRQLPAGSHYQFQWGVNNGMIFRDTRQLQAGDLVFFDTGNRAGGGANLNAAGHVGVYIGNGKMLHAANPSAGTIVSDIQQYIGMYGFLGGMHMQWNK